MATRESGIFQVSHSEMATFKECRRRWMLEYYFRLRKKRREPRVAADTGLAVHDALHRYYTLGGKSNHEQAYDAAMQRISDERDSTLARELSEEEIKAIKEIYDLAHILAKGYFEWVDEEGADDHWAVGGSEEKLIIPGPIEGTEIKGYIDLWGEHEPSGDLLVVDTKVVQSFGDTLKTLHINEQGPLYALMMKVLNPEREHGGFRVVWNMIRRVKQTSRAKPPFYQRYELAMNDDQLRNFYMQIDGQLRDMMEVERRLNDGEPHVQVAYPSPNRDCSWKCPFLTVCGAMNDQRSDVDWLLENNFVRLGQTPKPSGTVDSDE